jgi:hypothetical protein
MRSNSKERSHTQFGGRLVLANSDNRPILVEKSVLFNPGRVSDPPTVINTDSPRRLVANSSEKTREVSKEKTA